MSRSPVSDPSILEYEGSCILSIRLMPKSRDNKLVEWMDDGVLRVRVQAQPEKNKANTSLILLLSRSLNLPKNRIQIVQGMTSRNKKICIKGITKHELLLQLASIIC